MREIDKQVSEQVSKLIVQQDTLISYYTTVIAETLMQRVANVQDFANFGATFAYFNTLFNSWNVSETGDPMVCKEVQISLTDATLGTLRDMTKSHNTPILSRAAVPGFFTSNVNGLSIEDQQRLVSHFGNNINIFNFALRDSLSSNIEERIGLLTIQALTNVANESDYRGIFHIFPGGCGDVDLYRPKIGRAI